MTTEQKNEFSIQSAGDTPKILAVDVTVLYDPGDGRVIHMHHAITFAGAERQTRERQYRSAREAALRLGCDLAGLEMLHITDFQPSSSAHRVDLQSRMLVRTPVASRKPTVSDPNSRLSSD